LLKFFGPTLKFQITFSSDPKRFSPSISQRKTALTINVPESFLLELDPTVQWMINDVPYYKGINLSKVWPGEDFSVNIWLCWLMWILNHELAHFYAVHLTLTKRGVWLEYGAIETVKEQHSADWDFRRALEIDADIFAAHQRLIGDCPCAARARNFYVG
jgi:hypothetical protein